MCLNLWVKRAKIECLAAITKGAAMLAVAREEGSHAAVHLRSIAVPGIQIKDGSYGKFEAGNKLTYDQFQEYLDTRHCPGERPG